MPRQSADQRYRRRHVRRIVRFFEQAAKGRLDLAADRAWDRVEPHQDEWMSTVEQRNGRGVV